MDPATARPGGPTQEGWHWCGPNRSSTCRMTQMDPATARPRGPTQEGWPSGSGTAAAHMDLVPAGRPKWIQHQHGPEVQPKRGGPVGPALVRSKWIQHLQDDPTGSSTGAVQRSNPKRVAQWVQHWCDRSGSSTCGTAQMDPAPAQVLGNFGPREEIIQSELILQTSGTKAGECSS